MRATLSLLLRCLRGKLGLRASTRTFVGATAIIKCSVRITVLFPATRSEAALDLMGLPARPTRASLHLIDSASSRKDASQEKRLLAF